jgi:HK97 family phage portal protein
MILNKISNIFKRKSGTMSIWDESKWHNLFGVKNNKASYFEKSAVVYSCVNKRAEKVSQTNFYITTPQGKEKESKILNLLYKPNKFQSKSEFFYLYQAQRDLYGVAYIYILKTGNTPLELHLLTPTNVKPVFNHEEGQIDHYIYKKNINEKQSEVRYEADEIIACYNPNPLAYLKGLSPLDPAGLSIDTDEQLSLYHNNVLKNGGRIEGILKVGVENLTENQIEKLEQAWDKKYSGAKKSGRPLFAYGDMDYKNLGLTPTELSFIESKKMTTNDILMIFGIPKVIVSQTDGVNYANAKMGEQVFLAQTIKPLVDTLTSKLDEYLFPPNEILKYVDFIPKDIETELKKYESGLKNGYMSINEVREQVGLDAIKNGDDPLVPFNLTKLSELGNE